MKTIGLLGGMSWTSTLDYYRVINETVKQSLGGLHSAKIALYSIDFEPIEKLQGLGDWNRIADILIEAAKNIESAGADFLLICTNTMHKVAPQVEAAISIPLLHIADATGEVIVQRNIQSIGLLGTAYTMEQDFYKARLANKYDLQVFVPDKKDREIIHNTIYNELCLRKTLPESKAEFLRIITALSEQGAEAVVLGCTEIGMLIEQRDTTVSLLDTTEIHAKKAVEYAIRN